MMSNTYTLFYGKYHQSFHSGVHTFELPDGNYFYLQWYKDLGLDVGKYYIFFVENNYIRNIWDYDYFFDTKHRCNVRGHFLSIFEFNEVTIHKSLGYLNA